MDMPIRLPFSSLLVPVRQLRSPPTERHSARYACVVVLLPPAADPNDLEDAALPARGAGSVSPQAAQTRRHRPGAHRRAARKPGSGGLPRRRPKGPSRCCRPQGGSPAQRWKANPRPCCVCAGGGAEFAPDAAMQAMVAALQAAAFQLRDVQERCQAASPAGAHRPGRAGRLSGLDVTLATSAGNNLARWLTALPPNTLDAAGYRRLLAEFARRLGLGFKFYGEPQLKRLGAGAFLAVSQGNATRDAGIVHLAYRPSRSRRPRSARERAGPSSLVGKGICFDTGGTNLKTHKSMLDMHIDMEGSAVAVGSLLCPACAALADRRRLLARHHREQDRAARVQAAGRGPRLERHHHPGDSHRCRGPHGARRHAVSRGQRQAARHDRLCHSDRARASMP